MCDRAEIPLFVTDESAGHVIDLMRGYLGQHFADRTTRHGVFMDILGLGVLLTGESGLGKSELGLELVSRGHGLVADDAVDIYRISQTALEGRCPALLQNLLEVRGIGLLDIKAIFGETAVRRKMRLKLIVHLVRKETLEREFERLPYEPLYEDMLDLPVRKVVIAVDAGATWPCWWRPPCATRCCNCAASTPTRSSSSRHQEAMDNGPTGRSAPCGPPTCRGARSRAWCSARRATASAPAVRSPVRWSRCAGAASISTS
jgi:HPr kinase/phosphorylase